MEGRKGCGSGAATLHITYLPEPSVGVGVGGDTGLRDCQSAERRLVEMDGSIRDRHLQPCRHRPGRNGREGPDA